MQLGHEPAVPRLVVLALLAARAAAGQPNQAPIHHRPGETRADPQVATSASLYPTVAGAGLVGLAYVLRDHEDAASTVGALGALGLLIGPTAGHLYAGKAGSGGLTLRIASVVPVAVALAAALTCHPILEANRCTSRDLAIIGTSLAAAGGMYLAGTVWEIASASGAARAYNRAHGFEPAAPRITLAPIATETGVAPGVAIAGGF